MTMISQILLLLTFINIASAQICTLEYNIDYEGSDLANMPGDVAQCCTFCDIMPECKVYSWSTYNNGTCWLKGQIRGRTAKIGVLSSVLAVSSKSLSSSGSGSLGVDDIIDLLTSQSSSGSAEVADVLTQGSQEFSSSASGSVGFVIAEGSVNNDVGTDDTVNGSLPIIIKPIFGGTQSPVLGSDSQTGSKTNTGGSKQTGSGSKAGGGVPAKNSVAIINFDYVSFVCLFIFGLLYL